MEFILSTALEGVLIGLLFALVFPIIAKGVEIRYGLGQALVAGIVFAFAQTVAGTLLVFVSFVFILATLGLGLLVVVPVIFMAAWLIPTVLLMLASALIPEAFVVRSWRSAAWAGFLIMIVGISITALFGDASLWTDAEPFMKI